MNSAEGQTGRERLEAMLRGLLPQPSAPPRPAGCLLARSCAELVDLTAPGQKIAQAGIASQHEMLMGLLDGAAKNGELFCEAESDIEALAWHYLGVLQAVMNFPQAGAPLASLDRMINIAMLAWPIVTKVPQSEAQKSTE